MVMKVNGCCCCFSLKTGTIIVGVLGILTAIFMIVITITDPVPTTPGSEPLVALLDSLSEVNNDKDNQFGNVLKIVMAVFEIVMSTVLIVGAVKGQPKLVYSWLVLNVVQNGLAVILVLTLAIYLFVAGLAQLGFGLLISFLIMFSIQSYMILVVNSFHSTILSPPAYEYTMTKEPMICA